MDFAISVWPDYHQAIIDTVRHYNWRKIIYLYDSHDGEFHFSSHNNNNRFGKTLLMTRETQNDRPAKLTSYEYELPLLRTFCRIS